MNDIMVPKKSIRQIPLTKEKKSKIEKDEKIERENLERFDLPREKRPPSWQRKPLNPKFVIWLIAGVCLMSLFFGISILFSSATVIITPKTQTITFANDSYRVTKADSSNADGLTFEVLNIKQTTGEEVEATEEKEVSQKATGTIVIYNNYSSSAQRLINNTRFEANNGKIYRINSSVVVPGFKKVDGKVVPGSIEAVVFADQAGDSYNLLLADLTGDFKIPGFKGDPRYESFYARAKEDIVGGFIGKQRIVEETVRRVAEEGIKTKLKEQLLKELYAVKPENYLIFKDGYSIDYTKLADSSIDSNKVKISMEGSLNGIVFNNAKLSKYIATDKIEDFDGLPTEFIISDNLDTIFEAKDNTGLWKNDTIEIRLTGNATIKWLYDADAVKKDLAGKSESDLLNIMSKYKSSIASIKVLFRPVWTRYIPDDLSKIKIKEELL